MSQNNFEIISNTFVYTFVYVISKRNLFSEFIVKIKHNLV